MTYTTNLTADQRIGDIIFYTQFVECSNAEIEFQLEPGTRSTGLVEQAKNKYRIDLGGKNLLKIVKDSTTINGITFTQNTDGSISAQGTATANATFVSTQLQEIEPNRTMKLSGCPNGRKYFNVQNSIKG